MRSSSNASVLVSSLDANDLTRSVVNNDIQVSYTSNPVYSYIEFFYSEFPYIPSYVAICETAIIHCVLVTYSPRLGKLHKVSDIGHPATNAKYRPDLGLRCRRTERNHSIFRFVRFTGYRTHHRDPEHALQSRSGHRHPVVSFTGMQGGWPRCLMSPVRPGNAMPLGFVGPMPVISSNTSPA